MSSNHVDLKKTLFAEVMGIVEHNLSWENFTPTPFTVLYGKELGEQLVQELHIVSTTETLNNTMKDLIHNPLSWKEESEYPLEQLPRIFNVMDEILNELVGERLAEKNVVRDKDNIEQVRHEYELNSLILRVILTAPTDDENAYGLMKELMGENEGEQFMADLNEFTSVEENREFLEKLTSDITVAEETLRSSGPFRELLLFVASIVVALHERTTILTAYEDEQFLNSLE